MTVRERTSHVGALFQSYKCRDYPLRSGEDEIKGSTWAKSLQKWLVSDHGALCVYPSVWNSFSTQCNCLKDYGEWRSVNNRCVRVIEH